MSKCFIGPPDGWQPRKHQIKAWNAWIVHDCNHLELVWHRRYGKDEITLFGAMVKLTQRVANYWHMLPLQNQVRKAIWDAVNPRTGIRRIDEAFPKSTRASTRENDMLIRFKNGSTWQCLGSDNFQGSIGSTPAGIVYSEWAQSNPSARSYLAPILLENDGWEVYITTPRGKNHAYNTYIEAKNNPSYFAQLLTVEDTGALPKDKLKEALTSLIAIHGQDMGRALYEQEYFCSFNAAILGAFYGKEMALVEKQGRICEVPHDPNFPVYVVMDIGRRDDTAIWWYQVILGEVRVLEFHASNFKDVAFYCGQILGVKIEIDIIKDNLIIRRGTSIEGLEHRKQYRYETIWMPHDAKAKTLAAMNKSVQEQFAAVFGWSKVLFVPNLSIEDGRKAARQMLIRTFFNETIENDGGLQNGIECLRQHQREWNDDKKCFKNDALKDWTIHAADAFRYLAVVWREIKDKPEAATPRFPAEGSFNEMLGVVENRRLGED